jgi:putative DNA primase/helicase
MDAQYAEREAPQATLEALSYVVRTDGVRGLRSPDSLSRLRSLAARQIPALASMRAFQEAGINANQLYELRLAAGETEAKGQEPVAIYRPAYMSGLRVLTGTQLLSLDLPPRELLLSPWLPAKGLAMIHAERGIGKTWVALNAAHALNTAGEFIGWRAARPRRVVYLDGEMPTAVLQQRYATIVAAAPASSIDDDLFSLVASDYQRDGLPDLADPHAQGFYDDVIRDAEAIIVDNLSTICRSVRENEADSWGPVQGWCLRQRAAGRSVVLVHHGGKSGGQRGTSRKEDVLDSVIALRRPPDYDAEQGARFEVHYTKARGFLGDDAKAFETRLRDGQWRVGPIKNGDDDATLMALHDQGLSIREIAERTGLSRSVVGRRLKGAD